MKTIFLILTILSSSAQAATQVLGYTLVRSGGGQNEVVVSAEKNGKITAMTIACGFRKLPEADQLKTKFELTGDVASDAQAIFANKAILGQEVILSNAIGGTWFALNLTYVTQDMTGKDITKTVKISSPLVILDGKMSRVLGSIESQASDASRPVCGGGGGEG